MAADPGGPLDQRASLETRVGDTLRMAGVGVAGLVGGTGAGVLLTVLLFSATQLSRDNFAALMGASTIGFGIGLLIVALVVLNVRGETLDYIDLSMPSLRDIGWMVAGFVALMVAANVISIVFSQFGVSPETSSIEDQARQMNAPEMILVLIPLSWLVIGPGEELVFRNIIQKSLYDSFSRNGAVVVASVIFALVHIPQYTDLQNPSLLGTASTLALIFALSLILAVAYERTENLLVPIFIHGTWNALAFLALYLRITGNAPEMIALAPW